MQGCIYYRIFFITLLIRRAINAVTNPVVFLKHFFRFLAAARSAPPKIGKNATVSLSIFFDFWRQRVARRQKSEKMPRCHLIDAPIGRIDQMVRRPAVGRKNVSPKAKKRIDYSNNSENN